VQKHLIPAFISHGIVTREGYDRILAGDLHSPLGQTTRQAITQQIAVMFADRTGQQLIDTLALQVRKLVRDAGLVNQSPGLAESQGIIVGNYRMAKAGVVGAWDTFLSALSLPQMEAATKGLNMLSDGLGVLTNVVRGIDPSIISSIFVGLAGFVATVLGGATVVLAGIVAAFVGWPVIIGAAVVGALTAAGVYLWHHRDWVTGIAKRISDGLLSIPAMLVDAIAGMVSGIVNRFKGLLPGGGGRGEGLVPGWQPLAPLDETPGGLMQRQNWVPPARQGGGLVPVHNVIAIDGHKIAEAVSYYIAAGAAHVQGAARFDASLSHAAVDMQI